MKRSSARVPYRVDDALQGLETIVDWEDVVLTVRDGRELQRKVTKPPFLAEHFSLFNQRSAGSPVFR